MAYEDLYSDDPYYREPADPYARGTEPTSSAMTTAAPTDTRPYAQYDQNGYQPFVEGPNAVDLGNLQITDAEAQQRQAQAQQYYQQLQEQAGQLGNVNTQGYYDDLMRHAFYDQNDAAGAYASLSQQLKDRSAYDGTSVGDRDGGGATASGGWFGSNAPGGSGFPSSIYPSAFGEQYSTLDRPSWLQGPYTPPTWGGFTADDLYADPGYQTRLDASQRAYERGAAAQGSILSGGSVDALGKRQQDFAANEYGNAYARKYGAFIDSANLGQQGRLINEGAYQSDVGNNRNQYATRYQTYLDQIMNRRNAEGDYWQRLMDQAQNSLTAAGLARP